MEKRFLREVGPPLQIRHLNILKAVQRKIILTFVTSYNHLILTHNLRSKFLTFNLVSSLKFLENGINVVIFILIFSRKNVL